MSLPTRAEMMCNLENAIDPLLPASPRFRSFLAIQHAQDMPNLVQCYRALYFDFYYITDELVWYGVRTSGRYTITLADLVYGVVFGHDIFTSVLESFSSLSSSSSNIPVSKSLETAQTFRRLLLPWIRQLGYFLSFFPETQAATLPLHELYEPLKKLDFQAL